MTDFQTVAKVGAIAEGEGAAYAVNGRMVAVFRENGEYFAIDDMCPHMGASLADGLVEDGVVACPWHLWRFCIRDGAWCDNPKIGVDRFDLRVEHGEIQVRVPDPAPRPSVEDSASQTEESENASSGKADPEAAASQPDVQDQPASDSG